jgi:putative NADPH-quinone reductase
VPLKYIASYLGITQRHLSRLRKSCYNWTFVLSVLLSKGTFVPQTKQKNMAGNKVLIINGHPDRESFCAGLSKAYKQGAEASKAEVNLINIRDLKFNPNLQFGYRKRTELEPDLISSIEKMKEADHIVWVFPMWWYGYPALMKGFIDRTFLPGITFEYVPGKAFPKNYLREKRSNHYYR